MSIAVDPVSLSRPAADRFAFPEILGVRAAEAVRMPAELGVDVLTVLRVRMMVGPVFGSRATPGWWTFLTGPSIVLRDHVTAELAWHRVELSIPLDFEALSTDVDRVRWIEPIVVGRGLPPWSAVVAGIRSVIAGRVR